MADIRVDNHGSIIGITPMNQAAREWIEENVASESWQWMGPSLNIEPRYAGELIEGMREAGLTVE